MKALGLSFGRKMQNSEIMVKQVLKQLDKRGFETSFIRVLDLDIKPCRGCISCTLSLIQGKNGACPMRDDFKIIDEAIYEAEAIAVCAPVYSLAPSGLFKTVCDRLGVSHDRAFRTNAREMGEKMGLPEDQLVDLRSFNRRAVGLMSVGGAQTKHWTSLGLPQMHLFSMSSMTAVDAVDVYAAMDYQHLVANEELMARLTKMGDNLADALTTDGGLDKWYGDEGTCPVCHNDLLTVLHKENRVECPICGIEGKLALEDGEIKVDFPEAEQERSRLRYGGLEEHFLEIRNGAMNMKAIVDLDERLKQYV